MNRQAEERARAAENKVQELESKIISQTMTSPQSPGTNKKILTELAQKEASLR